jgi:2'-5' RNA ligase
MRLFIALDLDDSIREKIVRFLDGVRGFAPDARWVRPEALHVTLKFVGQWLDEKLPEMQHALQGLRADSFEVSFGDYGFFPSAKAARVFWIGISAGPKLVELASAIDTRMELLGVPREEHAFSPHLTLARRAGGSGAPGKNRNDHPNRAFERLQKRLAAMSRLDFGSMTARHLFLYQSELSPKGSRYTKLMAFPLT